MFFNARSKFKNSEYESAVELLDTYRRSIWTLPLHRGCRGMYALSHYYMSPSPDRDQTITNKAISVIDEFMLRYPNSDQREVFVEIRGKLMSKLHLKEYKNAYSYFKIERYKSAIIAFRNAMKKYPDGELREDVSYYIVASAYHLAFNSVLNKKEDRYLAMIDNYYTFSAEFPESEYREDADDMLRKAKRYIELEERRRSGED